MHSDNVTYKRLSNNPKCLLIIFLLAVSVCWIIGLGSGESIGRLSEQQFFSISNILSADLIAAIGFGLFLAINVHLIGRLPLRAQIAVIWLEIFMIFLSFFHSFDLSYEFILSKVGFLITQGAFTTLYVSAIAISIAFVLAIAGSIAKLSRNAFAIAIASFYTSFFRGVPLLILIYLIYIGLPQLGYVIDALPAGILALSLCYGAYMTEIFRAGIMSIPVGQWEASRALGLTPFHIMSRVILPQAMRIIIPPTGNQFIAMLKDSSLVSVIGVWELMFLAKSQGQQEFKHLEMLITASLIYWAMSMVLEVIQSRIELRLNKSLTR